MKAQLLQRNEIDLKAWDALVADSPQGSVFVYSWYLDVITPNWQAIIIYEGNEMADRFVYATNTMLGRIGPQPNDRDRAGRVECRAQPLRPPDLLHSDQHQHWRAASTPLGCHVGGTRRHL